ncbi:hypothetical protein [Clostridium guangxiense]|uniref:hypothetical protein n=2 Tax=Clostridium TaxID=1485 RepID=UPI001E447085|nr:hypothetical protein [Clostridium guangxiense]MCD2348099.1 hypothetical protein [Clostridium guangxiense]
MEKSNLTDANANDTLMHGRTATIVIAGSNAAAAQKSWADGVCIGSSSNCIDDAQIQALINEAVANEFTSIYIQAFGTFWIGKPICIPYGLNFYVNGEGIPNVDFNIAICTTTPTAGTQFRSSAAWNTTPWYGTCNTEGTSVTKVSGTLPFDSNWVGQPIYINGNYNHVASVNPSTNTLTLTDSVPTQTGVPYYYSPSIFVRVNPHPEAGTINAKGQTRFENCALMPAFGDAAYTVPIYGLTDEYGANLRLDNFMFLPWGWFELGQPAIDQTKNVCMAFNCQGGNMGGGTDCTIGSIYIFAHGGAGPCWESIIGYDCVRVRKIMMYGCFRGISFQDAWLNEIDDLVVYAAQGLAVAFNTNDGHGNIIHRLNYESLGICWMGDNPLVYLYDDTYVQIDYFFNWPSSYSNNIITITNDDSRIEKTCLAFNLGDSGIVQVVPRSVTIPYAFGGIIATPFLDGGYPSIGIGSGNMAVPTSGNTYYVRDPVDITISGGADVSIICKDAQGNIIDNGVTSLNHRFLLGAMRYTDDYLDTGCSIAITYTIAPTVVVVQAEIGSTGTIPIPISGVNYVASKIGLDISFSGGTGVSATTMDGSSNTGGNVLDTGLTSMVGYHLSPGQIINFGNFTIVPSSLVVRRHSEL